MIQRASSYTAIRLCVLQGLCVVLAIFILVFAPAGATYAVVIPVAPHAGAGLLGELYGRGALPVDAGPLPGSVIVADTGQPLFIPMLRKGRLVLAFPSAACGSVV